MMSEGGRVESTVRTKVKKKSLNTIRQRGKDEDQSRGDGGGTKYW